MNDSFGDGWNGASVDILVGGTVVATTTGPASGSASENLIFSATLGETIELSWTSAGSWSGEISWSVLDGNDGSEIGSGGNPSDGLQETVGLANCTPAACPAPTDLTASGITTTGAVISWVSDGTQFMIELQPAGSAQGTEGGYVVGDIDPYTATSLDLTGFLTANTSYDIYVVNVCDADSSSDYAGPLTFTTPNQAACGETVVYDQVANGDYTVVLSGGNPASVTINGNVESGWDYLYVTDGAGNALNADQNTGIFTDATYTSTDGTISVNIVNDGSIQNGEVTMTFSCVPPDTTAPVITLTGDEVVELFFGDSYTDAGASAVSYTHLTLPTICSV